MEDVRMIPTQARLVRYNSPQFVRHMQEEQEHVDHPTVLEVSVDNEIKRMMALRLAPNCPDTNSYEELEVKDILNVLIPPIDWIEDGKMWRQTVSTEDASRDDLLTLAKNLDNMLSSREAATQGVCLIRRELYSQLFDELIRQLTVLSPETGVLLMRIRDELHMTMDAHTSLYETSKYFDFKPDDGPPKAVMPPKEEEEDEEPEVEVDPVQKLLDFEDEKVILKLQIRHLEDGIALKEAQLKELMDANDSFFEAESEHLKKVKIQLEKQLKLFKGPNPHADTGVVSIVDKFLAQGLK